MWIQDGYFEKQEDGELYGYGVEYLNTISTYTNWKYEFLEATEIEGKASVTEIARFSGSIVSPQMDFNSYSSENQVFFSENNLVWYQNLYIIVL